MTLALIDTASQLVYDRISKTLADAGRACYVGPSAPTAVEGTGDAWVCLVDPPAYMAAAGRYGQARRLSVVLNVYADASRTYGTGTPYNAAQTRIVDDAASRALAVYELVSPLLDAQNRSTWPQILTSEFVSADLMPVPDGDGSYLLSARYNLTVW